MLAVLAGDKVAARDAPFTVRLIVVLFVQPNVLVTVYLIVAVPAVIPVTTPAPFTVAIEVSSLLHTPPAIDSPSVIVELAHKVVNEAVITPGVGSGLIVTDAESVTGEPQLLATA